jgi:hypothetical protein
MFKVSVFRGETERGAAAIPLFGPADGAFEKTAAPTLLSDVTRYIATLRPSPSAIYVLVNAMGAGEFYGSNINGDYFSEASLIHAPDDWTGKPILDIAKAKEWPYGFPTFYDALPYAHHRNKEPSRAYGAVELAAWNPKMRRVELVVRVDKDKCERFAGTGVWDKLQQGQYPDVSMGCKVPFDTCSICLDWDTYRRAQSTFDPKRHKSPGDAVLAYHKELLRKGKGIRGLSPTRKEYCEHTAKQMNRILPDGRKVFVYNDYPRFFDISFVFIGADKTAKVMLKIAEGARVWSLPSAELAEKLGYDEVLEHLPAVAPALEKAASAPDEILKSAFIGKLSKDKQSEIVKDVLPSQFAGKAVPLLTKTEPELPNDLLDTLGAAGIGPALSTTGGLGIVLRPREFQRIILISTGHRPFADRLDDEGTVFRKTDSSDAMPLDPALFSASLAQLLLPLLGARSALGPAVERRILVVAHHNGEEKKKHASLSSNGLDKIGAAYNGYRSGLMELVASAQELVGSAARPSDVHLLKLANAPVAEVFTPLSFAYLTNAFLDELGDGAGGGSVKASQADVERGFPSRNTWTTANLISGAQKS